MNRNTPGPLPDPLPDPVPRPVPVHRPVPVDRPVLKCRCGGLYLNPGAHRDAFGHRPEPVAA